MQEQVAYLDPERVDPSPYQPRTRFNEARLEELARSIREQGVIQPIVVRPTGERYELVAGERRLRAARKAGLARIPAIVRDYSNEQALEAALVENLQREEITLVEAAHAYQRLLDEFGYSQGEVAIRTGKSRSAVANLLRLLHLPEPVLALLHQGELSEGHARVLLQLPSASLQDEMAAWIVRNSVPVREVEARAKALLAAPANKTSRKNLSDPHVAELEEQLRRHFATRAVVTYRRGKGTLSLEFYSDEDLWRLLEQMGLADIGDPL